jgi:hypothetical protein
MPYIGKTPTDLADLSIDTTPKLGGDLDVNGKVIISATNGNISITPNGSGDVILDGLKYPQADGDAGQVLKTDGSAQLSWVAQTTDTNTTYSVQDGELSQNNLTDTLKTNYGTGYSHSQATHAPSGAEANATNTAITTAAQEWSAQQNFNALALTFNATQAWNLSTNQVTSVTLTAAITFSAPTNQKDGSVYVITLIQDGTGSRTAAWNTVFKFAGGTVPTLTTTASAKDILTYVSDGPTMNCIAQVLNLS